MGIGPEAKSAASVGDKMGSAQESVPRNMSCQPLLFRLANGLTMENLGPIVSCVRLEPISQEFA